MLRITTLKNAFKRQINSYHEQPKKSCHFSLAISINTWIDGNMKDEKVISHTQVNNGSTRNSLMV